MLNLENIYKLLPGGGAGHAGVGAGGVGHQNLPEGGECAEEVAGQLRQVLDHQLQSPEGGKL